MTDPTIQQLYCTHCTYGSSALHRHTGNVKDQPFEYSTRAGSIRQSASHQTFQQFESQIFRGLPLPSDTPADFRRQRSGANSPWRRLVVAGSQAGNLIAHVAYRTADTSKPPRIGSYFAHVLIQETADTAGRAWSLADALQMWGSDFWVVEDRDSHPFELATVTDLRRLPGFGKVINDDVLISFLTTAAGGKFHDGSATNQRHELSQTCAIPERWRRRPAEERLALFTTLFQSVLKLNLERRERLLLAVEPSVAALLFYGVVRLLPRNGLVEQLSVSTFEPHDESSSFVLSATDFFDPEKTDLSPNAVRGGIAINSYSKKSLPVEPATPYLTTMLNAFLDPSEGVAGVEKRREEFAQLAAAGLNSIKDIEQFLSADGLAERFVQTSTANLVSDRELASLSQPAARQKFRNRIVSRLKELPENHELWRVLAASSARTLSIIRVLREQPTLTGSDEILERLCDGIPARELPRFFEDELIPAELRLSRLQREVMATKQLPEGCDFLWTQKAGAAADAPLLERMFGVLDASQLDPFCRTVVASAVARREITGPRVQKMLTLLAKPSKTDEVKRREILVPILTDKVFSGDDWEVLLRNPELRAALYDVIPANERFLQNRLVEILDELPQSGSRFFARVDLLKASLSRIPTERREDVAVWSKVRGHLQSLKDLQTSPQGGLSQLWPGTQNRNLEELGKQLGLDSSPFLEEQGHATSGQKLAILKPLATACTGSSPLPKPFLTGLAEGVKDPETPVSQSKKKKTKPNDKTLAYSLYAAAAVVVAVIGAMVFRGSSEKIASKIQEPDARRVPPATVPHAEENSSEKVAEPTDEIQSPNPENGKGTKKTRTEVRLGNVEPDTTSNSPPKEHSDPATQNPSKTTVAVIPPEPGTNIARTSSTNEKKLKGPNWKPTAYYEARQNGLRLFEAGDNWRAEIPVEFLTLHGPQLFPSESEFSEFRDESAWPLIVTWNDDLSIKISTVLPGEGDSPYSKTRVTLRTISYKLSQNTVVPDSPSHWQDELKGLDVAIRKRLETSWRNCVLGIHFRDGTKTFHSLNKDDIQTYPPKKAEPQELAFQISNPEWTTSSDKRPIAISSDAKIHFSSKVVSLTPATSDPCLTSRWRLNYWSATQLSPLAIGLIDDTNLKLCLELKFEVKKKKISPDDEELEFVAISEPKMSYRVEEFKNAFEDAAASMSKQIKSLKNLSEISISKLPEIKRITDQLKNLRDLGTLFNYYDLKKAKPANLPTIKSYNDEMSEDAKIKWIKELNAKITSTKAEIDVEKAKTELEAILFVKLLATSQTSFSGSIYRIESGEFAPEPDGLLDDRVPPPREGLIRAGIGVKVAEYRAEKPSEEKKP